MAIYVGYTSALWTLVRAHAKLGRMTPMEGPKCWLKASSCNKGDLSTARKVLGTLVDGDLAPCIDVLVRSGKERRHSRGCLAHVWGKMPAAECFYRLEQQVYVSTPEFCFLQMARVLKLHELIQLGEALCGGYFEANSEKGFVQVPALTTVRKLEAFIGTCKGLKGVKKARRALRCICGNSRSPMETLVSMLLTMSRRLGGYGLPKAELNYRVNLSQRSARVARTKYCLLDICWPEAKLALEYNGAAYHRDRVRDENRRMALLEEGWTSHFVGSEQVHDGVLRNQIVRIVARKLGKRLRKPTDACVLARRRLLGQLLPERSAGQGWQKPCWALPSELAWE